ncbi:uncharacterized protein N7483_000013 [Penicillium malachiteum]|uniref:uncharacterized protein n=1 Tax=Penicillium malachiteum TaxID=1324776 RepID=UPI002548D7A9|nr:uncharacterized protein N7483_000013 [Penicillium malachiteum]KAJ5734888.1 hypothetical protein N7483_000013 [Penicillium malachiteum]
MALSNSALIVIILVCCLSSVSLAAAMFGHFSIAQTIRWSPTIEQQRYMRDLRMRYLEMLYAESRIRDPRPLRWKRDVQRSADYRPSTPEGKWVTSVSGLGQQPDT